MLMVVFGAGASYDSVPSRPPIPFPGAQLLDRPPLANELFADRPRFVEAIRSFPKCQPVIPYLRHLPRDGSVEQVLEGLQAEAEEYPERHRQLAAVRFYLHFMLWECERYWNDVASGVTNYKTLLDQLERVDAITLVSGLQQGVLPWIAHHHSVDAGRLEQVVQPGGAGSFFKGYGQVSAQPVDKLQNRCRFRFEDRLHYQLAGGIQDHDRDRCLMHVHANILVAVHGVLLLVSDGAASTENLPLRGALL